MYVYEQKRETWLTSVFVEGIRQRPRNVFLFEMKLLKVRAQLYSTCYCMLLMFSTKRKVRGLEPPIAFIYLLLWLSLSLFTSCCLQPNHSFSVHSFPPHLILLYQFDLLSLLGGECHYRIKARWSDSPMKHLFMLTSHLKYAYIYEWMCACVCVDGTLPSYTTEQLTQYSSLIILLYRNDDKNNDFY